MTTKFKKSFSPMLICWNDIKIHLGFEDSYFVPPPITMYDYNFRKCHTIFFSLPTHCNGTRAKEQTFSSSKHSLGLDNLKKIISSDNQY